MVTVKIGKSLVSIKADKNFRANIEDKVSIKIPAQKCHLFDQKTGDRLGG
jgi:multiple sugar transport system ATP-binding protein